MPNGILGPGERAPDFRLKTTPDQSIALSELRGRPVILAFYPADWSPVCGDQMALYNEVLSEFRQFGAELMGIQWSYCSPVGVNPGADGILQALEGMRASRTAEVV